MSRIAEVIESMAEADAVADELRRARERDPDDGALAINRDAVLRRRADLEAELGLLLHAEQLDLLRYRVEQVDGSDAPVLGVARSIVLFQTLLTTVFDAVRAGPRRRSEPSSENIRLSSLNFARPPSAGSAIHFLIANDRLLALESDLDVALELMFELLDARAKTIIRDVAARAGVASVAAAHAWAGNAVQHGLTTTISWRKKKSDRRSVTFSHSEALLYRTAIEAVTDDSSEVVSIDCEIISLDEAARSFRLRLSDKSIITGQIADGFPLSGRWGLRHWYRAELLRATRLHYATGEESVRWSLRGLTAAD